MTTKTIRVKPQNGTWSVEFGIGVGSTGLSVVGLDEAGNSSEAITGTITFSGDTQVNDWSDQSTDMEWALPSIKRQAFEGEFNSFKLNAFADELDTDTDLCDEDQLFLQSYVANLVEQTDYDMTSVREIHEQLNALSRADFVVFASECTYVNADSQSTNYGQGTFVYLTDPYETWLQFDLSDIPPVFKRAELVLHLENGVDDVSLDQSYGFKIGSYGQGPDVTAVEWDDTTVTWTDLATDVKPLRLKLTEHKHHDTRILVFDVTDHVRLLRVEDARNRQYSGRRSGSNGLSIQTADTIISTGSGLKVWGATPNDEAGSPTYYYGMSPALLVYLRERNDG